jgi:cell division septation protein DedD
MLRDVRDEDFDVEEKQQRDVEVTLGPAMLLAIACGLLLLCGLCFGVGYTAGRRNGARAIGSKETASGETLAAQEAAASAATSGHKPAPTGAPPVVQAASAQPVQGEPSAASGGESPAATQATPAGDPAVRPAMGSQAAVAQPAAGTNQVQPALPSGSGVMVQVAAVSHVEDATVLMGALRKHGYAVTARREPDDNLIHVQIGPFASRADASAMSQRLLNDGYNAVVLP